MALQRFGNSIITSSANNFIPMFDGDNTTALKDSTVPVGFPNNYFPKTICSSYWSNTTTLIDDTVDKLIAVQVPITTNNINTTYVTYNSTTTLFTMQISGNIRVVFRTKLLIPTLTLDNFFVSINALVNGSTIGNNVSAVFNNLPISSSILQSSNGFKNSYTIIDFVHDFTTGDTLGFEIYYNCSNASPITIASPGILASGFNDASDPTPTGGADYTTTQDFSIAVEMSSYVTPTN